MKKQIKGMKYRLFMIVGICMLVIAGIALIAWQWGIHISQEKMAGYVHTIYELIPEPQSAVPEERRDNTMPVLSIEGINFVGILEMPKYVSAVPVCADWGQVSQYPSRLTGSVYDRTIQIGATTQKGQYDFYREISVGDLVYFTDMEGNRFAYEVSDIRYEAHADQTTLQKENADFVLFIQNIFAFEYIIVYCNIPQ